MKFWTNFKYFGICCSLLTGAFASEDESVSYVAGNHIVRTYSSEQAYVQKLHDFLNDKTRTEKYKIFTKNYNENYKEAQKILLEPISLETLFSFTVFLGTAGLWIGSEIVGPDIRSPNEAIQNRAQKIWACSGIMGALIPSVYGIVERWFILSPQKTSVIKECPPEELQLQLGEAIKKELFSHKYLTAGKTFPIERGKEVLEDFVKTVCTTK